MILRNFLYLNEQMLDNYLSAIEGYIPTKVIQTSKISNGKNAGIGVSSKLLTAEAKFNKGNEIETQMEVEISPASKIQKLIDYLNKEEGLSFYDTMDENIWEALYRETVVEFMGTIRFSKLKEITNAVTELEKLSGIFQELTPKPFIDLQTQKYLQGLKKLNDLQNGNEIPCVLTFTNTKEYQAISYLDKTFFHVSQENFVGDVTILCKIQKKIDRGNSIQLNDIFKTFKEMPLNREQRRQMPNKKQLETPKEFSDIIKGPAFVVIPIAIYN